MRSASRGARTELNKSVVLSLIFLVFAGFCVSRMKYEVAFLKNKLKEINTQLDRCQDDIKIYNAEWSYLNEPKRLQRLATKYLPNLRPTENRQIINFETLIRSDFDKELSKNITSPLEQNPKHQNANRHASEAFGSFLDKAIKKYERATESD
ncbi:MAG: hypothetical protein II670_09985 [Alphaproteobacteria bacterium]|nr:hypothetical protein [Alphaproteobacteria bacterium]